VPNGAVLPSEGVFGRGVLPQDLDSALRFQQGVRGYLDFQDKLNASVYEAVSPILAPAEAGLDLLFANVLEAGKFATAAELKIRETDRLAIVGRADTEAGFTGTAVAFNDSAQRAAGRALRLAQDAERALAAGGTRIAELANVHRDANAQVAIDDARESITQGLVKFTSLSPEDFQEVQSIWDDVSSRAKGQGVGEVLRFVGSQLEEFTSRRAQPDRGTGEHSPLPWWKYVLIASVLGAAVIAVVVCFWWFACTWILQALPLVAPWVFGLIDRGC
jgi:hypothetical protein